MILYVSDFDLSGSGYMNIGTNLCHQLVTRHELGVVAIGLGYDGREHHWPYAITPCPNLQAVPPMIQQIRNYGAPLEALVVALDIPLQEALLQALKISPGGELPYVGIFPLEAGPLCMPWAMQLMRMDARLIMSRFGQAELARAGVDSTFIPIGVVDPERWRPPLDGERQQVRQGLGYDDDTFVVLTVADNQERKNLAGAYHVFADFAVEVLERDASGFVTAKRDRHEFPVVWNLVTRVDSPVGWKLDDLGMRLGIYDKVSLFNRGVPPESLWALFVAADCFLLTSKAEGLAIPVMEAMAVKTPCVGTDCAAIAEHLGQGRGLLVDYNYVYTDPYGNGERRLVSVADGVACLERLAEEGPKELALEDAYLYVKERTWQRAGDVLAETIKRVRRHGQGQAETLLQEVS